jgi:hypothetical protein
MYQEGHRSASYDIDHGLQEKSVESKKNVLFKISLSNNRLIADNRKTAIYDYLRLVAF